VIDNTYTNDIQNEEINDSFGVTNKSNKESIMSPNISSINYIDSCITNKLSNRLDLDRDDRMELVLKVLDLESILPTFINNKLNFNDMLFLSKEDMIELDLALVARNRILKFSEAYKNYGKEFSADEILIFFGKNRHFVIKPINYNKSIIEDQKVFQNYENHVLPTANFLEERIGKSKTNEFIPRKIIECELSNQDDQYELPRFNKYLDGLTLSDYVQRRLRDESEEKSCQTQYYKNDYTKCEPYSQRQYPNHSELDLINIKPIETFNKEELNNTIKNNSISENQTNTNIQINVENDIEDKIKLIKQSITKEPKPKSTNIVIKYNKKDKSKERTTRTKKQKHLQKQFSNIDSEVDSFMKSFRELKEKSDDRLNRLRCFIERSKSRSLSKNRVKDQSKISNYDSIKRLGLNLDDLEIEDERNLQNEMSKLLNRINSASKLSLDSQGMQQLNRIKSLTNLRSDNKNIELLDVNHINQVDFYNIGIR
jgi:hypothetical protein